jgi:hypothetical protein
MNRIILSGLIFLLAGFKSPQTPTYKMDIRNEKGASVVYMKDNKQKLDSVKVAEAEDLVLVLNSSVSGDLEVRGVSDLLIIRPGSTSHFGSLKQGSMKELFPILKKMKKGDTITMNMISYTEPGPKYRMLKNKGFAFVIQ